MRSCPCGTPLAPDAHPRRLYCTSTCRQRQKARRNWASSPRGQEHHEPVRLGRLGTAEERFWIKVERGQADECWTWIASTDQNGYGLFHDGRQCKAHRWAYEQAHGPIPGGMTIDHTCRNRSCVNVAHMQVVTLVENIRRRYAATA
jgi:hypothetical protein